MTDGTTFERLKKIIADQLSVNEEDITPEASFIEDLERRLPRPRGAHHVPRQEEFGVKISDEDAEKIQKVSDAVEFIEEHQQ